jgi:hypothetical protein
VSQIKSFFDHIEAGYVDSVDGKKPMHVADPQASSLDVLSFQDFQALSTSQIQDRLRKKNVIVTGCGQHDMQFEACLRELSRPGRKISIQGTNPIMNTNGYC